MPVPQLFGEFYVVCHRTLKRRLDELGFDAQEADEISIGISNLLTRALVGSARRMGLTIDVEVDRAALERDACKQVERVIARLMHWPDVQTILQHVSGVEQLLPPFDEASQLALHLAELLDHQGVATERLVAALAGSTYHIYAGPPLAVQRSANGAVSLLYWAGLIAVLEVANTEGGHWVRRALSIPSEDFRRLVDAAVTEELSAEDSLVVHYRGLCDLLHAFSLLAHLQWETAEILGLMWGTDRAWLGWYPYVKRFHTRAQLRENPAPILASSLFRETVEAPAADLNVAGHSLRHVVEQEPVYVPVCNYSLLATTDGNTALSCRITLNHPLMSMKEAEATARAGLNAFRRSRRIPLTADERRFLEDVWAARKERGLGPDEGIAPDGFWKEFHDKHPEYVQEKQPSGGKARGQGRETSMGRELAEIRYQQVKYSRLRSRLRSVYGEGWFAELQNVPPETD